MMTEAEPALRAAVANAFLFRCSGIPDLALGYLRDSFKLLPAGAPMATPPRGSGERFFDWLDAAQKEGRESGAHRLLRKACLATSIDPPPLGDERGGVALTPARAEADLVKASMTATELGAGLQVKEEIASLDAIYWFALLLDPNNVSAHHNLGLLNIDRRNWDVAIWHFEAELAQDPTARAPLQSLHNIATQGDRMAQLAPHLETLLRLREKALDAIPSGSDEMETAAPVIALAPDNGETVGRLVGRRGAAHVRGATLVEACVALRLRSETIFAVYDDRLSLPLLTVFPDARDLSRLLAPGMVDALVEIFGRMPDLSESDSYIRRVMPETEGSYIPFHQDVTALATTGLNVWVPLIECGEDAPGLEIMARRTGTIFPTIASSGDYNQTEIAADEVYAAFPPEVRFYPRPDIGDAVLFLGSTVHRSHVAPGMTRSRISVEMRFY